MKKNTEKPVKNSKKIERDEKGRLKKGVVLNPHGRPKGSVGFATKWKNAIDKIAEQNEIDPDDVEQQLLLVAYKKAKSGDYSFYKDIFDRVYGKAEQSIDHTTGGDKIIDKIQVVFEDYSDETKD